MAISYLLNEEVLPFSVVAASLLGLASLFTYLFRKPPFPGNAPPLDTEHIPILGALRFFTDRWDFVQRAQARSHNGNFSFYAGQCKF